jgi:pimeloyl-ACP methyl ester carboxylesterase
MWVSLYNEMKRPVKIAVWLAVAVVVFVVVTTIYSLVAVRGTFQKKLPASEAPAVEYHARRAEGGEIVGREFGFLVDKQPFWRSVAKRPLIVVLHGDAPFHNPGYQYAFASMLEKAVPGVVIDALLRPGYSDPYGLKSDGDRGFATGENYTADVISDIAKSIDRTTNNYTFSAVFLVGHSGGAAIAASVAALNPGLIDHVYLVGCPCDVPAFRKHMASAQHDPMWLLPVNSLSPMDTLDQMQKGTAITAISGSDDPITLPEYARAYIDKAKQRGLDATFITIPGEGHEILLDQRVIDIIAKDARAQIFP